MRIVGPLLAGNGRAPQLTPGPFRELLPLRLRNRLSGKGGKTTQVECLLEMTVLFACLKKNEFEQAPCSTEIAAFQSCYDLDLQKKRQRKLQNREGVVAPGGDKMTYQQLNKVLAQHPAFYPPRVGRF